MTKQTRFPGGFLWGGATAANQLEGGFGEGNKGLNIADVLPGGKERLQILSQPGFNWEIDKEKYHYPNHLGIDFYHHYKEDIGRASCRERVKTEVGADECIEKDTHT